MNIEEKLFKIYECIDRTCNSSVKLFDVSKHTSRSVGTAAYEERQNALLQMANDEPEVIQPLCKKSGHWYFKFQGRVIKIISSSRDPLGPNVFAKNAFETNELDLSDRLLRIIYKTDYDIAEHEANIRECHYIEVDRNTGNILFEIDILKLAANWYLEEVITSKSEEIQLPIPSLIPKKPKQDTQKDDNKNDK